jgi:hypothetical protein
MPPKAARERAVKRAREKFCKQWTMAGKAARLCVFRTSRHVQSRLERFVGGVESPNVHICGNFICGADYRFRHINLSSTTRTPTAIKSGICDPVGRGRHEPGHSQLLHPDIWTKVVSIRERVRMSLEDKPSRWRRRGLGEPDPNCRGYRVDDVNRLEISSVWSDGVIIDVAG